MREKKRIFKNDLLTFSVGITRFPTFWRKKFSSWIYYMNSVHKNTIAVELLSKEGKKHTEKVGIVPRWLFPLSVLEQYLLQLHSLLSHNTTFKRGQKSDMPATAVLGFRYEMFLKQLVCDLFLTKVNYLCSNTMHGMRNPTLWERSRHKNINDPLIFIFLGMHGHYYIPVKKFQLYLTSNLRNESSRGSPDAYWFWKEVVSPSLAIYKNFAF